MSTTKKESDSSNIKQIEKLNGLFKTFREKSEAFQAAMAKAKACTEVRLAESAATSARHRLTLATRALPFKVKFDSVKGEYFPAIDEKSGKERFRFKVQEIRTVYVEVLADDGEDADRLMREKIEKMDFEYPDQTETRFFAAS